MELQWGFDGFDTCSQISKLIKLCDFKKMASLHVTENPDACVTAAEIYECGMENQMVVTYNMTEVGEGNSSKVSIQSL